jgi:DNA-binding GntR family transcriptional regulator
VSEAVEGGSRGGVPGKDAVTEVVEGGSRGGVPGKDAVVEAVRAGINAGELVPGQRLVEGDLATTLRVTRASVRAAIAELAAEGLLERVHNRGARIRSVSVAEAVEITECRMVLEGLCAAKAAAAATTADIAEARRLGDEMTDAVAAGELLRYSDLNHELHALVRRVSGQSVATALLERLNAPLVRHRFRLALRAGRAQESLPQHLAIVAAIAGRDPEAAEVATRTHLAGVVFALQAEERVRPQTTRVLA